MISPVCFMFLMGGNKLDLLVVTYLHCIIGLPMLVKNFVNLFVELIKIR